MKRRVAISILGTTLDAGKWENRWSRWRPNVALCQQPGLFIDRLELIHDNRSQALCQRIVGDIGAVAPATEVRSNVINFRDPWDFSEVYTNLRDFARNYSFDPDTEDYLVNITTGTHVAQICWFLLTEARIIPGQLLQLSPPRDREPEQDFAGTHRIIDLDLSRYDEIAKRFASEREDAASFLKSGISTRNAAFNRMIDEIEKVVIRSTAPVLLTGPTGAGKSQLARRIYELKRGQRKVSGPFIEVNCATLRGDQAMSTLFGHVKGAFTGAAGERAGLLKSADKGVLFLDEIGELGRDEQAMCLRAIEEKRFLPVGADRETSADFQLLAGTNRDLGEDVRKGRFREDLYARLNLWTFQLPALRERKEDIEPNLDFELKRYLEREGENITFNKEARDRYLAFATGAQAVWSANFRDLSASVTRMATLAPHGRITTDVVDDEVRRLNAFWRSSSDHGGADLIIEEVLGTEAAARLDHFDAVQLATVLHSCREHATASSAGRALFAVSRLEKKSSNDADRLTKYLARFGLRFEDVKQR
ncbi:sigma 54-interacting transcriptional regulator [Agrobacterium rhizogenes]|jgi:transcriptional regulatory protein RtcR|uniref:Sigma-54 interaction domain protein n=1 Tax=Rhizobium rhizogenes TaxID=359 RepID=A0A7S4ZRZ4_RHIRH|nr:RNA repair transcriptional activator RtcR [Rhizobium rhizogenes]NTF52965.1 sigma 54-interacting transcriptional regulator [Rhizobium rhizogenes]NTH10175.1 sigma 54-interacting transcriptional regulator [Rhizobium rhizogenes]NTH42727.1 sigma 54-interacting transcriptional regulator [Rhizobium rhizogenes]NTI06734.1 sigma 54-interacting transcriptional regulator [Rhizobium rhizogenes]NTI13539.1 sigma 54-interacting transcriptional regulator [Rhizobium rhizogenes]